MFEDWSRQELLQLGGITVAAVAVIVGAVLRKDIKAIHVLINSRLSQLIAGAEAAGQVKERAEADARTVVKEDKEIAREDRKQ